MNPRITIFWFRRDLRLTDNKGLYMALKNATTKVMPIFIFDTEILENLPKTDARVAFIYQNIQKIQQELEKYHSGIHVFKAKPLAVFKQLKETYTIEKVVFNHDYEPYALKRDKEITTYLQENGIALESYKDHVIFQTNQIVKKDKTPYLVYSPYAKKWLANLEQKHYSSYKSEALLEKALYQGNSKHISLEQLGFFKPQHQVSNYHINTDFIANYADTRNFPSIKNGTSLLSTHLRFGTVSIRKLVQMAVQVKDTTFLKELIWREFFMQILWHFPKTTTHSFKPVYDRIIWRNNMEEFTHWKNGTTGYPMVDAGMRELNQTGLMHNRVRMVVASFLCKHLLIDWRLGEAYFAEKLLDFELASNIGNWQWAAGSGVDAAPYFRIFNPEEQFKKFDKTHAYVKKWVPEYQSIAYTRQKIVDHKMARERCLAVYKQAVQKNPSEK